MLRTGGPGRPAEYCDLPEHTRWRAWRERQRIQESETQQATVTVTKPPAEDRPASSAHNRAEELTERVRLLVGELATSLTSVTRELNTMTDPATVAAELEATRTDAARRIALAQADVAKADQRRRAAQRAADQAEAAARDAVAAAEQAELDAAAAREAEQCAVDGAWQSAQRAEDDIAAVKGAAQDEIAAIRRDAADIVEQARIRAEARIEQARRQAADDVASVRAETAQALTAMREQTASQLAVAHQQRDAAVAAVRVAELAAERAGQSATDARAETHLVRAELAEARQETALLRQTGEQQSTEQTERFQRELATQRADAAEAFHTTRQAADTQLAALAEVRAQLLSRAERAEAQLDALLASTEHTGSRTGGPGDRVV
ncbi:MAG TPA: hypothetical protein VH352_00245 [Pseudonocardiaceae bacterium]|nr:hypothetical protein [Pseudonocardiaceae bacterium]